MGNLVKEIKYDGETVILERRSFLRASVTAGLATAAFGGFSFVSNAAEAASYAGATAREVVMHNAHTGEKFRGEYWHNGRYLPDAFKDIKSLMKDHRTGETYPIDPRLMDILYVLQKRVETDTPFEIFSGYRSPKTNAMLRRLTDGVAEGSLHMQGQAVDLRLPGYKLSYLRRAATSLKAGGVGYYPESSFVHLDTGRVRHW